MEERWKLSDTEADTSGNNNHTELHLNPASFTSLVPQLTVWRLEQTQMQIQMQIKYDTGFIFVPRGDYDTCFDKMLRPCLSWGLRIDGKASVSVCCGATVRSGFAHPEECWEFGTHCIMKHDGLAEAQGS